MRPLPTLDNPPATFDCNRSCPARGEIACRFSPIFRTFTRMTVDSHTARIACDYDDPTTLEAAVKACGGIWYGYGRYDMHDSIQHGYRFRLQMKDGNPLTRTAGRMHKEDDGKTYWYHACVLTDSGELAYDEFGGSWGDVAQLSRLKSEYVWTKAKTAADAIGWLHSQTADTLTVYHPHGGRVEITSAGAVEAHDFHGVGCAEAIEAIAPGALDLTAKPELYEAAARCQLPETR